MAENVTLAPIVSFVNDASAAATYNSNNGIVTTALADCLSISGTQPNAMQSNLDMNQKQIINLPAPSTLNSPLRLVDATGIQGATGATGPQGPQGIASNLAYLTNRTSANLSHLSTKLNSLRVNSPTTFPVIHLIGDSITFSSGALLQKNSLGARMATLLTNLGYPATDALWGNSLSTGPTITAWDPRLTFTGTWGQWTQMPGGKTFLCTSNAGTMTYTPGYSHDTIDIYWQRGGLFGSEGSMTLTLGDGGTFSWATFLANGGSAIASGSGVTTTTISFVGVTDWMRTTITRNAAANSSVIITNGATNQIEIAAVEAKTSTVSKVLVRCMGFVGQSSSYLTVGSALSFMQQVPATLNILCIGRNDLTLGNSLSTYAANLATIIPNMLSQPSDGLIWTWPPSAISDTSKANQLAYTNVLRTAAGSTLVLADEWQRYEDLGAQEVLFPAGWYADSLHPSSYGTYDIARFLTNSLVF